MSMRQHNISIKGMRSDYSRYALPQYNAIQHGLPKAIEQLVKPLQLCSDTGSVRIIDLGAADGVNSFPIIEGFAKAMIAKHSETRSKLYVTHVDVPTADFNSLIANIYNHPNSYLLRLNEIMDVQPNIEPNSFYATYGEPHSADVVFATTCLHYASTSVCSVEGHVDPLYAKGEKKQAWSDLSRADMDVVMNQVHRSLRKGGKFWAIAPAHICDENTASIKNHWNREVWDILIEQLTTMEQSGALDSQQWQDFVIPVHQRKQDEWIQWFFENSDKFTLDYAEVAELSNPYLQLYLEDHQDPKRFADDYLGFFKSWAERILTSLVPEEVHRIAFYKNMHKAFEGDPQRFADDNVSIYVGATAV